MSLQKLSDWPSSPLLKKTILFAILLLVIVFPLMNYYLMMSNFPVSFVESQLSFSGTVLKTYYRSTNIDLYRIAQVLDYGFMLSYGLLFFSLSLILARNFEDGTTARHLGYFTALLGITAAVCDAIENGFILIMLTDPLGFPNIFGIIHSMFALIKFVTIIIVLAYLFISLLIQNVKMFRNGFARGSF